MSAAGSPDACRPVHVPDGAEAILVLAEPGRLQSALDDVRLARELNLRSLAIIVVVVGVAELVDNPSVVVQAQCAFHASGADDVLLQVGDWETLRLAIHLSVARVQLKHATVRGMEANVRSDNEGQLKLVSESKEEQPRDSGDGMFWQCVHRVYPFFPPLHTDISATPNPGQQVGPCRIGSFLGRGASGSVFAATDVETSEGEVVKVYAKEHLRTVGKVESVWREMVILAALDHPNIIQLRGSFHGPRHVFVRLEMAGRLNLFRALLSAGGRFAPRAARGVQAQLTAALAHCHSKGVAHRDVKPENVGMCDLGLEVKLLDFGDAALLDRLHGDRVGTPPFIAPEVAGASPRAAYDAGPADVWSSGIVLFEMLCSRGGLEGLLPWGGPRQWCGDALEECRAFFLEHPGALAAAAARELAEEADGSLMALFSGLLDMDPRDRWTADEAANCGWLQAVPIDGAAGQGGAPPAAAAADRGAVR